MMRIEFFDEPNLLFGNNNIAKDPRDGLLLFGPYEKWGSQFRFNPYSISAGLIGSRESLGMYKSFVQELKKPIISAKRTKRGQIVSNETQRPSFPGFEAVFNIHWPNEPDIYEEILPIEIELIFAQTTNRRKRTALLVELFLSKLVKASKGKDSRVNIWFVVVPKKIFENCRATRGLGTDFNKATVRAYNEFKAGQTLPFAEADMFGEDISGFIDSSSDFHHLLKARSNQERVDAPLQILVQPKLDFRSIESNIPFSPDMKAHFAWSLSTTVYYKLGKKPWKLYQIREGVCYLGLVFKRHQGLLQKNMVCSAAQLFLSDGDGTIFRGNNGLWMGEKESEYHLDEKEAANVLGLALDDYHRNNDNKYPEEMFIHGRAAFSDNEWHGFENALKDRGAETKLVGVVIQDKAPLKLYRDVESEKGSYGVMRGIAWIIDDLEAYLFTRGFVPRLNTSMSMEVPNPLRIRITRGNAEIKMVLSDIMALTKLNYNACLYGDGKPVTLRFSDTIGSILTATPNYKEERRQFQFYI